MVKRVHLSIGCFPGFAALKHESVVKLINALKKTDNSCLRSHEFYAQAILSAHRVNQPQTDQCYAEFSNQRSRSTELTSFSSFVMARIARKFRINAPKGKYDATPLV